MAEYNLSTPLNDAMIRRLRIGDLVTVSGPAFTCRSKLQRYIFDERHVLPEELLQNEILIHVGPIILPEDGGYRLISFMPTSSVRFEKWGPQSIREWGLKIIIGKTTMGAATMTAMQTFGCVHLSPRSVSPNLWCDSIRVAGVHLYEEMGSIEAPWQLQLNHLGPFVVDIDTTGSNLFDQLAADIQQRKKAAYRQLGIPEDFKETKLY